MVLPDRVPRAAAPQRSGPPLTPEQRRERRKLGGRARIGAKLIRDYCAAVSAAYSPSLAASLVGVSTATVRDWHATAAAAQRRDPATWSQYEVYCVRFTKAVEKAIGDAGLRVHRAIAEQGGVIRLPEEERPKVTTRTIERDAEGNVLRDVTVERSIPYDWRAAAHVARYRFPVEMGGYPEPEPDEVDTGHDVSPAAVIALIRQVKAQRAEAGIIDATSTSTDPTAED